MESTNKTLAYASGLIPLILGLFSIAAPAESYGHEISQLAPGGSCNSKYATPCARANGRWLAETVASSFEDALRSDDSSRRTRAVLESITSKELNRDLGFYPFVFSRETEKCVAHGAHEEFVGMSIEEIFDSVHLSYAHPDALYERFMAAHRDWIPYLWSDDGQGAHDKLAYIVNNLTDVSGDQSYFLGVGYENEPLPLDLPCSDKYDRWCSLTNVESLVGRAQFELEQANSRVDLERTMYRISNDEKRYKAPEGFYLFMYSFSGNLVASGTLPDSSFGKSLSEIFVDMKLGTAEEGQALHETLRDAVSGDNPVTWVQYPWRDSPDGDSFRKVAFLVKVQFGDELFYIGSGFRFAVDKIFAAPLGEVCSDEYNLPCSFHIAHQLSSHCLTHVTSSSLPREQVFEMITRDPDFRHDDFYLFVYSFDGVCMAHGGDETFVGMRLDGDDGVFNKVGIPLNATELDARFREAAATGGGWVTYDWVNLANLGGPTFKKITYIFQITIDNEDYYGGIGFNHLRHPLEEFSQRGFKMNGEPIPCSRKFGDKCSEINARSILGQALAMLTLSSSEASAVEVMSLVELDRYPGASSGGPVTTAKTPIDQVFKDISSKDPDFRVNDFSASVFSFGSNQACGINDGSGCAVAHGSNKYMGLTWNQILELEDASTIQGSLLHHNLIDASNSGAGSYKLPYQGTNMRAWVAQFKHEGERYYVVTDYLTTESDPTCLSTNLTNGCPTDMACSQYDQSFCEPLPGKFAYVTKHPAFIVVLLLLLASIPFAVYLVHRQKRKAKKEMTEVQKRMEAMKHIDIELGDIDRVVEDARRRQASLIVKRAALQDTPSTWTNSLDTLVPVSPEDEEYWTVIEKIRVTIPNSHISKLWRVQNSSLWSYYMFHKDRLETNNIRSNERRVWHGTSMLDPAVVYNDQMDGFMMQFAAQGLWGRGIYFADKASYSKNYSHCPFNSQPSDRPRPEKGELEMFQARLLVGKDVKLDENKSLTVPPTDSSSGLKYNSVTGHTAGSQIWIVYENGRAYPEYLVRYYIGGRDTSRSPYASKAEARISAKRRGSDVGLNELNDPTEKSNSQSHAHRLGSWEYCSDSGWVAYGVFDQILIEKTFQDFSRNKSLPCTCAVKGPEWEYEVNVATMVQTNMQHVSNTQRKIRFHLP